LGTGRLRLRPLTPGDLDVAAALLTNPEVAKHVCDVFTSRQIEEHPSINVRCAALGLETADFVSVPNIPGV